MEYSTYSWYTYTPPPSLRLSALLPPPAPHQKVQPVRSLSLIEPFRISTVHLYHGRRLFHITNCRSLLVCTCSAPPSCCLLPVARVAALLIPPSSSCVRFRTHACICSHISKRRRQGASTATSSTVQRPVQNRQGAAGKVQSWHRKVPWSPGNLTAPTSAS